MDEEEAIGKRGVARREERKDGGGPVGRMGQATYKQMAGSAVCMYVCMYSIIVGGHLGVQKESNREDYF